MHGSINNSKMVLEFSYNFLNFLRVCLTIYTNKNKLKLNGNDIGCICLTRL
jgi:hypothetical protein